MSAHHARVVLGYEFQRLAWRWPFFFALLGMAGLAQVFWFDPLVDGFAMLAVNRARIAYDSQALAVGFSANVMLFIGLIGFYLVRGNAREEWRSGLGSVMAVLPVSNAGLLLARWFAAVLCLALLSLAALAGVLLLHWRFVEAPIQWTIYLQTWIVIGLPGVLFAASVAICCDAYVPLIGRLGDVLYFVVWMGSAFAMEAMWKETWAAWNPLLWIDFAGHYSIMVELSRVFASTAIKAEHANFDAGLTALNLPSGFWSPHLFAVRIVSGLLAVLPLWFAVRRFHRYSPDRLAAAKPQAWGALQRVFDHLNSPLQLINRLATPFEWGPRPLLRRAAHWPGLGGQIATETGMVLMANPVTIPVVALCVIVPWVLEPSTLGGALQVCLAVWGLLISSVSTRDAQGGWAQLAASLPGGLLRRFLRQCGCTLWLGLMLTGSLALRLLPDHVAAVAALFSGLALFTLAATLLGQWARQPRAFLALFLSVLMASDRMRDIAAFDTFGANGLATLPLAGVQLLVAVALFGCGLWLNRKVVSGTYSSGTTTKGYSASL